MERVQQFGEAVAERYQSVVVGRDALREIVLVATLARGHALISGVPGVAKTLVVKVLARAMGVRSARVQFTAETLPSDVVGTVVFDPRSSEFLPRPGPAFAGLLLADEINRAPPRTQAALLEVMEERTVTLDGTPQPVDPAFTVVATRNPTDHEGTWELPLAELDRFLLETTVGYPSEADERELLSRTVAGFDAQRAVEDVTAVGFDLEELRGLVRQVMVVDAVRDHALALLRGVRAHPDVLQGPSPRAGVGLVRACQARAALHGRDHVTPDDVAQLAGPVLAHRLQLAPAARLERRDGHDVVGEVRRTLTVPR